MTTWIIAVLAALLLSPLAIIALAGVALAVVVFAFRFLPAFAGAREYSRRMQKSGYLPAPPSDWGQWWMQLTSWIFVKWLVGKVEIVGLEKLDALGKKPVMICPDHPNMTDVVLVPHAIKRKARYMAASAVMSAFGGFGGWMAGNFGAFGCDLRKGKGGPAREAAITALTTHQILVMWPEGWTNLSPVMGPFKKGAVSIARAAATELSEPVYIVPVHLHYNRYPGKWVKSFRIDHQYWLCVFLFPFYRKGVKVIFGDPIASDTLDSAAAAALAAGKLEGDLDDADGVATAYLKMTISQLKANELAARS